MGCEQWWLGARSRAQTEREVCTIQSWHARTRERNAVAPEKSYDEKCCMSHLHAKAQVSSHRD